MTAKVALFIASLLVASVLLGSCGKKEKTPQSQTPPATTSQLPAKAATLTFYVGDVKAFSGGTWTSARLGMELSGPDSLKVGKESEAELTLPGGGTVRVGPGARSTVAVLVAPKSQESAEGLGKSLVTRAKTLSKGTGDEKAATPTATAGIRGVSPPPKPAPDTTGKGK